MVRTPVQVDNEINFVRRNRRRARLSTGKKARPIFIGSRIIQAIGSVGHSNEQKTRKKRESNSLNYCAVRRTHRRLELEHNRIANQQVEKSQFVEIELKRSTIAEPQSTPFFLNPLINFVLDS